MLTLFDQSNIASYNPATVHSIHTPATVHSIHTPATVHCIHTPATVHSIHIPATVHRIYIPVTVHSTQQSVIQVTKDSCVAVPEVLPLLLVTCTSKVIATPSFTVYSLTSLREIVKPR